MDNSVQIKGYKDGMILRLDPTLPFNELKEKIYAKFQSSAKFLGSAQMALTFQGRTLSQEEQKIVMGIISETTDLEIICIFDNDEANEELLKKSVDSVISSLSDMSGRVYRGVLPSGKELASETTIIIVGNVEKGATVRSGGSIIVLGALYGNAFAGTNFNKESFVYATVMQPEHMEINTISYVPVPIKEKKRGLFRKKTEPVLLPMLATVYDNSIIVETVTPDTYAGSEELEELL